MKILIIGKHGMLAQEVLGSFRAAGYDVMSRGRPEADLCRPAAICHTLLHEQPSLIINTAAYTDVEQAESDPDQAFATNRDGLKILAMETNRLGIPLIHISTDYVFDGTNRRPYREDHPASPLGVYGTSKWEGEEEIRQCHPHHVIIRTAWLYSVYGKNFLKTILKKAKDGQPLQIVNDQWGCPTWAKDLASALLVITQKIFQTQEIPWGTFHYCASGKTTWYEFAQLSIRQAQVISPIPVKPLIPIATPDYPSLVKRPAYSVLDCSKIQQTFGIKPTPWEASVQQCVKEFFACPDLLQAPS